MANWPEFEREDACLTDGESTRMKVSAFDELGERLDPFRSTLLVRVGTGGEGKALEYTSSGARLLRRAGD